MGWGAALPDPPIRINGSGARVRGAPYDVSVFERELLPRWVAQYRLPGVGNYSFLPNVTHPHPYAASDVLHAMCFTGQLGDLLTTASDRDAYAAAINGFQRADGFYATGTPAGGSLWHAAGYVTAGLAILGRSPLRSNTLFDHIAETPGLWQPTVDALLNVDASGAPPPFNITAGCSSGYSCAQNIASLLSWQVMTNDSKAHGGGMARHAAFASWYLQYLAAHADPVSGLWCSEAQRQLHGLINCIGGSFHIDFVFQFLTLHPDYVTAGDSARFPHAAAQLNASLGL